VTLTPTTTFTATPTPTPTATPTGAVTPCTPLPLAGTTFYVDPVTGSDSNPPGNPNQPWRTLTFALCVTGPGKIIRASAGTYSTGTNGEQFPLTVRGQRLESTVSRGAVIEGVGLVAGDNIQATFDMQMGTTTSQLVGFRLTGTMASHGTGVLLRDGAGLGTVQLQDLEITGHDVGVQTKGTTVDTDFIISTLSGNTVNFLGEGESVVRIVAVQMSVGMTGLRVVEQAQVNVRFSSVTGSASQNVEVSSPNTDLGRTDNPGFNSFQGAAGVNIWNRTTGTLNAVGNTLDARPVTQSNTNQNDGTQNVANEFFPLGCTKTQASDCL
jgi:hypothetical protein